MQLTSPQRALLNRPLQTKFFLSGPAGCGKTTVGVERLGALLAAGTPAGSILVLTPQRTLQAPYESLLQNPSRAGGEQFTLATVGGLARRMVELFWPLAAEAAGFGDPSAPPVFLTLETAQYYMARIVRPLLDQGLFASVTINRNRLYGQILDNLNKSAAVGFSHAEIGERLSEAWEGDPAQRRIYTDAQDCASRFRDYCLKHNLLDFSLQLEVFWKALWHEETCHSFLVQTYRHLIYDNLEEDTPVSHDLILEWLPDFESALLINDEGGGYRRFLGADPDSGLRLRDLCQETASLSDSFITSSEMRGLEIAFLSQLQPRMEAQRERDDLRALRFPPTGLSTRFYPQMLDWVADEIRQLVTVQDLSPSEIVVLAPYLSDALRFSLKNRLEARQIPVRSHRPSRSLRDEPASACLLTLAELAHPTWDIHPTKFDVAYALRAAIDELDLVRAQLLAEIVYRARDLSLSSFEQIKPEVQERLTFVFGERYERLRTWLEAYRQQAAPDPLDHFLRRLFGEVLSQKGFGFHRNFDAARVSASLIESVQKFRQAMEASADASADIGLEYLATLQEGVIAAQYLEAWHSEADEAVLLAPAYTFLMMNRPATVQFWLDVGSSGWWERLYQPLTHPYVLARFWENGKLWTDLDEQNANAQTLERVVLGLLHRCRQQVYLGISDLGEQGFEQRGPLLKAIWKMQLQSLQGDRA